MKLVSIVLATALVVACTPSDPAAPEAANAPAGADDAGPGYDAAMTAADAAASADAAATEAASAAMGAARGPESDATPRRFSKTSFDNYVYGMTKRELRQRFGSPGLVHGDGTWVYFDLPVFDEDAGTKAQYVSIKFMGMGGMEDEVAEVSY